MFVDWSDPNSVEVNIGADPDTIKLYARSNSLSAGSTDAQADAMQSAANYSPLLYSFVSLYSQAGQIWQKMYSISPQDPVSFNLVIRTINPDGTFQDHLIASFTCNSETVDVCNAGDFGKLSNFEIFPWFKEAIDNEAHNRK